MAIVLLVALLITNLFMSSNNNRMGREGLAGNMLDGSGNNYLDGSGNRFDGSGNFLSGKTATPATNTTSATPATPAPATTATSNPGPASMIKKANNKLGYQNLNSTPDVSNMDLDKMQALLEKSKGLMNDLKGLNIPGMPNILGGLGQ